MQRAWRHSKTQTVSNIIMVRNRKCIGTWRGRVGNEVHGEGSAHAQGAMRKRVAVGEGERAVGGGVEEAGGKARAEAAG